MLQRDVAKYSEMVAHWSGEARAAGAIPPKENADLDASPRMGWWPSRFPGSNNKLLGSPRNGALMFA